MNAKPKKERPIYLDNQATTPVDPRVLDAMLPYFTERFGNPHSRSHAYGWEAEEAIEMAREQVAALIGAHAPEIVFTSGATEANNLAIKGVARFYGAKKRHLITCVTEHMCVLDSAFDLEQEGFEVTYLGVDGAGLIDLDTLAAEIRPDTVLVSIMAAHNEIGVLQSITEIGALCRERKVFFHTDAAQAAGKIPLDVDHMKIDLMSLSAHKVYGPKGVGALYRRRRPRVRLKPLFSGGGQEGDLRSGTLPTPLCVGLGEACRIAGAEMGAEAEKLRMMRGRMTQRITDALPGARLNGDADARLPGSLNFSFAGVDSQRLIAALPDLALSWGSACSSAEAENSPVLRALGLSEELARSSLRIGLGRFTTETEVERATMRIIEEVERLSAEAKPGGRVTENAGAPAGRH